METVLPAPGPVDLREISTSSLSGLRGPSRIVGYVASVVVIEDEEPIAAAVAAGDGPSGVALVERLGPDLVVLDLMLPGFDGLEVCRRIQKDRPVPVLMLTARDSETDLPL